MLANLKRFKTYWWESIKGAREAHETVGWVLAILAWLVVVLKWWLDIKETDWPVFSEKYFDKFAVGTAIFLTVRLFLWVPFKRHEAQEKKHLEHTEGLERSHQKAIQGLNTINTGHVGALNSMVQRLQSELESVRQTKAKADEDFEIRKQAKTTLGCYLVTFRAKEDELRGIHEMDFEGEVADKFTRELEDLIHMIYDQMFNMFKMGAEASLFYSAKPAPIQPSNLIHFKTKIENWRWQLSILEAKYNALRSIVEKMV